MTGGFVALVLACRCLAAQGLLEKLPIRNYVAGVSAGIVGERPWWTCAMWKTARRRWISLRDERQRQPD